MSEGSLRGGGVGWRESVGKGDAGHGSAAALSDGALHSRSAHQIFHVANDAILKARYGVLMLAAGPRD